MSHTYTVIIQETTPASFNNASIWIIASIAQPWVNIAGKFIPLPCSGGSSISITSGVYTRTKYVQASEPTSPEIGDSWQNTTERTSFMYLGSWQPYAGG